MGSNNRRNSFDGQNASGPQQTEIEFPNQMQHESQKHVFSDATNRTSFNNFK